MYFIPQRFAWYRSVAQIRPLHRYVATMVIVVMICAAWWYSVYTWLDAKIMRDQAHIAQLTQQVTQLAHAERTCSTLSCSLGELRKQLEPYSAKCSGEYCQNQLITLIDEAQKSNLNLTAYSPQKEVKKSWCTCNEVQIGLSGSLDGLVKFFKTIKQSKAMIQCDQVTCSRIDGATFNATCAMRFIAI